MLEMLIGSLRVVSNCPAMSPAAQFADQNMRMANVYVPSGHGWVFCQAPQRGKERLEFSCLLHALFTGLVQISDSIGPNE